MFIMKKTLLLSMVLWLTAMVPLFAQDRSITGKVTGDDGSSLPGVNIAVKGTNKGTNTDVDGAFKLLVPSNAVLIVSSVGYAPQEVKVGNRTVINVSLASTLCLTMDELSVISVVTLVDVFFIKSSKSSSSDKIFGFL